MASRLENAYAYVGENPSFFVDPFGLAVWDSYPTPKAAGIAAVCEINGQSIEENVEYAGSIYQSPDGTYSYTAPYPGTEDGSGPLKSMPPGNLIPIAWYHTHGALPILGMEPGVTNIHLKIATSPISPKNKITWRTHGTTCIGTALIRYAEDGAAFTTMVSADVQND